MLLQLALAFQVCATVKVGIALMVEDEAASFIQKYASATNKSSALAGDATRVFQTEAQKKTRRRKPLWQSWLEEEGWQRKAKGDKSQPLFVFLVKRFKAKFGDDKMKTPSFQESQMRWDIGAAMLCSEVPEIGHCRKPLSGVMHTNSIPLLTEYRAELEGKQFNGDVIFSTHTGTIPRGTAERMEANGTSKPVKFIAEHFLMPLMRNPVTVRRMFFLTCNAGTRFEEQEAWESRNKKTNRITFSSKMRLRMNTGVSFIDMVLRHVAEYVREKGVNDGIIPTIYGSNGFTYNYVGTGPSELRVHQLYYKKHKNKQECELAATMNIPKAPLPCKSLDYTYAIIKPAHWSLIEPNIERFGYPKGLPKDDMPGYPENARVAGFLKAKLDTTENDDGGWREDNGMGGHRADGIGMVYNVDPETLSGDSGACTGSDCLTASDNDDSIDEDTDVGGEDEGERGEDDDDDDSRDEDEDPDASLLQTKAARAAAEVALGPVEKVSGNNLIREELWTHVNATALDSHLVAGHESFSEEETVRAFRAMIRILRERSLTSPERRDELLQAVAGSVFPNVFSSPFEAFKMPKQWFENPCLEEKLRIPLAIFEAVTAVISVSKCDSKLMCTADTFDILSALGSTAAHFQYGAGKCSHMLKDNAACSASVTELGSAIFGIVNTATALAHKCNEKFTPGAMHGSCGVTATFTGGWALLAVLSMLKIVTEPNDLQGQSMDLIFASSFFSKMVLETIELCDDAKSLCGKEVAELVAYIANTGGAMKRAKDYCKVSDMCTTPDPNGEFEEEDGQDPQDNDRDGIKDHLDLDNDNDGVPDELDSDKDGDEVPDNIDVDDNNDGVKDIVDQPSTAWWWKPLCMKSG